MRLAILTLLVLCLASPAFGATTSATKSGVWSDATIWDTGSVPGSGDWAKIGTAFNVTASGTVTADSLFLQGNLTTAGDVQCVIPYIKVTGGALTVAAGDSLIQAADPEDRLMPPVEGNTRKVWIYAVGSGSTVNVFGHLAAESANASANTTSVILAGGVGSAINVQGSELGSGSVTALGNSAAPKQLITVDQDFAAATHVQLVSGWHKGAIYEIESRPATNQLLLKLGKIGIAKSGLRAVGVDSTSVVQGSLTLEKFLGSVALYGAGDGAWNSGGARVNNAFDNGDSMAVYFDDEHALTASMAESDSVYFSEALFPGADITFFQAATVSGNIDPPALWPVVSSEPNPAYGQIIVIDGDVNADWAHIRNMGNSGLAGMTTSSRGTLDIDHTYISDFNNGYMFTIIEGGTDAGKSHDFSWNYISDNVKKFDNASDGHFFMLFDGDDEDSVTWQYTGFRRLTDDSFYIRQGAALTILYSWMTEANGLVAFADGQANEAGAATLTLKRNWCIGSGDDVVQMDGATGATAERSYYFESNFWSRPKIKWNRFDAGDGLVSPATVDVAVNELVSIRIKEPKIFESLRDTIEWYPGTGFSVDAEASSAGADTIYVRQGIFRNGGFYFGDKSVNPSSTAAGTGVSATGATAMVTVVESCTFTDNGSRGDLSGFGAFSAFGTGWKGVAGDDLHIRRCLFNGTNVQTGATEKYDIYHATAADLFISHSKFVSEGDEEGAVFTAGTADITMWRSYLYGYGRRYCMNLDATGSQTFKFNTFAVEPSGKRTFESLGGPTIIGNVFVSRSQVNNILRFAAVGDTVGSVIDWNIYRIHGSNIAIVAAASYNSADWLHGYDQNGSVVVSDGPTLRNIIWREAFARLIAHNDTLSVAHDFVSDTAVEVGGGAFDEDGSVLDAGAMPLLNWKN